MDQAITILLFVFIIVVLVIALFCVVIVTRDVILESREHRREIKEERDNKAPVATVAPVEAPKQEVVKEVVKEVPVVVETPKEEDEGNVNFDAMKKTLDEKYRELDATFRIYYDEIVKTAMAVENSKRYKNDNYEEYKLGKSRIVRLKIKRDTVIAELLIPNLTLKEYISDNKVEAKLAPTVIKVVDQASLDAVKDSIGIAVKVHLEEKELKKEQAKEKRRLAREAKK